MSSTKPLEVKHCEVFLNPRKLPGFPMFRRKFEAYRIIWKKSLSFLRSVRGIANFFLDLKRGYQKEKLGLVNGTNTIEMKPRLKFVHLKICLWHFIFKIVYKLKTLLFPFFYHFEAKYDIIQGIHKVSS